MNSYLQPPLTNVNDNGGNWQFQCQKHMEPPFISAKLVVYNISAINCSCISIYLVLGPFPRGKILCPSCSCPWTCQTPMMHVRPNVISIFHEQCIWFVSFNMILYQNHCIFEEYNRSEHLQSDQDESGGGRYSETWFTLSDTRFKNDL